MAYSKQFKTNPSLVNFVGGTGRGFAKAGEALISLGNDKIAKAKADALKKEVTAKAKAFKSANNAKNRTLNPEAVKKMASTYGIDENSPLFKKGAPSQFNADLSLIDLGKAATKKRKANYTIDNVRYDGETNEPIATTPRAKKTYKPESPKAIGSYIGEDEYRRIIMSDGREIKSKHKVRQTQGNRKTDPNLVSPLSLGAVFNQKAIDLFKPLGILSQIDGKWVMNKSKYNQYKARVANIEVE
jgi:hypothetical protein